MRIVDKSQSEYLSFSNRCMSDSEGGRWYRSKTKKNAVCRTRAVCTLEKFNT